MFTPIKKPFECLKFQQIFIYLSNNQIVSFFCLVSVNVYAFYFMNNKKILQQITCELNVYISIAFKHHCRFLSVKFNLIMIEVSLERMKAGVRYSKDQAVFIVHLMGISFLSCYGQTCSHIK